MKRTFISVMLAALAVAATQAAGISWAKTYGRAKAEAKSSGKLLMIDFYTDWCVWCKRLDSDTYPAAEVVKQSTSFVPIKLNAEKDADGIRLAKKFKIDGYPTVLFIDGNENLAFKVVGYAPPQQFAKSMRLASTIRADRKKYETAVKANPRNFDALVGLASVYASTGETDKAGEYTDRAAKCAAATKKGKLMDAYNAAGDGFQNAAQYPKAIGYFSRAIDSAFPKQAAYARISIAACYFAMQQPKQAVPFLESLLKQGKEANEYRSQAQQMLAAAKKSG